MSRATTASRLWTSAAAALLLASAGCLAITPGDGELACAATSHACPSGYYCSTVNQRCYRGLHDDGGAHDGGAHDGGARDDGGGDMLTASCTLPTDCPPPAVPCLQQACINSQCGLVATNSGTVLPPALQTAHDCQSVQCDGSGKTMIVPDASDVPADPTGGCNTTSCNGAAQVLTPTAAGTSCTEHAGGVCNGSGVCGACKPGATQCSTTKVQQLCTTAGAWMDNMTCSGVCSAGVCAGNCDATYAPNCVGATLQQCTANQIVGTACKYACCNGACTGSCAPNSATCNAANNSVVSCNSCGAPTTTACAAATPYCLGGKCVGCQPGAVRCCADGNPADSQTCGADGSWGACAPCQTGAGSYTCGTASPTTISCSCSTSINPCQSGWDCGFATDVCGQSHSCGDICSGTCSNHVCTCGTKICI